MKSTPSPRVFPANKSKRLILLTLVSLVAVAALLSFAVSANKANRTAKSRAQQAANIKSAINPLVQDKQPNAPNAAVITATLSDNTAAATKVPPGSTITYTAVISNTAAPGAGNDATSVIFSNPLDANTTLVPNSVNASPIATNDSYSVYGNVNISIPDGVTDLLGNDIDPDTGNSTGLTLTTTGLISSANCALCNNVNINANGSFTYDPPVGFTGADTFTYTVRDNGADGVGGNGDDTTAQGTVTLNISGMIWFINNAAPACTTLAAQCGKLSKPFSSLDSFRAVNLGGALQPAAGHDIFIYQSATENTLTTALPLLANQRLIGQDSAPNATAINSPTLFNITLPTGSATLPSTDTGGTTASITAFGLTAATGNTIRGLTVNNTGVNTKLAGTSFGTLTLGDINTTGTGKALNLVTGTLATHASAAAQFGTLSSTSSASQGVQLSSVAGSLTATGGAISGSTSSAFQLGDGLGTANTGGTVAVTYPGTLTATGSSRCVDIQDRAVGAGNVTFSGTLTHTTGAGTGILMDDNAAGTITFSGANSVLNGFGSTAVNLTDNAGATINFTGGGLDIDSTTATAFNATGPGPAATSGGTINVTGTGNSITSTTGIALNVASTTIGASNLNFQSISANGGAKGISLNTTGATGGLNVTGTGTTDGTGGTIQNITTRGAEFISASNITLKNMNFTNAATTDSGTNCANLSLGGNSNAGCNAPIHLDTVTGATLTNLNITGSAQQGINGRIVTTFALSDTVMSAIGNAADEDGLHFRDMLGTCSITNTSISGSFDDNLIIQNLSGATNLTISGSTFTNSTQGSGILFGIRGTSNSTITINNATQSTTNFSGGIVADTFDTSIMSLTVTGVTSSGNNDQLSVSAGDSSNVDLNANNNTLSSPNVADFVAIGLLGSAFDTGYTFDARIQSNTITTGNNLPADGIVVNNAGGGTMNVLINGNTLNYAGSQRAILIQGGQDGVATSNVTMTGNTFNISLDGTSNAVAGVLAQVAVATPAPPSPGSDGSVLCFDAGGSTPALRNTFAHPVGGNMGGGDIRVRQRFVTTVRLPGYSGANNDNAAVVTYLTGRNTLVNSPTATATNEVGVTPGAQGFVNTAGGAPCTQPSPIPPPLQYRAFNRLYDLRFRNASYQSPLELLASIEPFMKGSGAAQTVSNVAVVTARSEQTIGAGQEASETNSDWRRSMVSFVHKALKSLGSFVAKVDSLITPTVYAQDSQVANPNAPLAGETITINGGGPGFTLPAGKSITVTFSATVNTTALTSRQATTQGTVTASGGINVQTDDPDVGGTQSTATLLDTTLTWTGATDADWNTATNWNRPGPVASSYAPGVSNPAVNDVIIPNVGAQPNISASDIGIYSLNLSNGRTLTITNPRTLTIGGSPGGDLTLDGIISGGFLNFGTGAHSINNAGGTGSLSSTDVATVLSGGIVTLNNNLQAGALAVNVGGSMTIATRTLSLNGTGGLVVPGGVTFTTTGSTVIFNGTAAQQAAGIAYNNLTINNTAAGAPNALGATLAGNATVNGVLALTSNDLNTGGFTLTQPNTTASTGAGDVVGTVQRTGGPFGLISLTFGNPSNVITFTGAGTRPTTMTVAMAKAAPATYAAAVQRNYTISQTGGSLFTATVRLHYLDSELNGNTPETALGLRRFRAADSHWVAAPPPPGVPTRDGANNWIEATGVLAVDLTTQWTFSTLVPTASGGTVTGRIVDDNGNPIEGAVVRLEGTQNRKFITDANGYYRFDNVETNGFYTVTPSRANYSFTPSVRSFSQIGESTEAAFGATLTTSTLANPLDTPEYFVRQHYLDFLNREPDEAGFNFWSDQIIGCGTDQGCIERKRVNVSAAYFLSIEFQRTGGLVDGLYRAAYGARPDFAHFLPDTRTVGNGVRVGIDGWEALLASNTETFVNSFVNRAEFHAAYDNRSNADYVDTLISHTGVSFTSAERDALLSGLGTGAMTRAQALRSIAEDGRFVSAKFNETFVMMEYFGYLRRDADANGFAFWLNKLNQFNGNFEQAEMVKAFIVSGEYRNRFPR